MTPEQVRLVRAGWQTVLARSNGFAARFYATLFTIDASAAPLFDGVDAAAQERKLTRAISVIVESIDQQGRLLDSLAPLAKRHVGYGVELHHFASVGDALLLALADALGSQFTPELRAAWAEAYALIASVMKRAIERSAAATS